MLTNRTEEFVANMSDKTKRQILKEILANIQEGMSVPSACWAADLNPDVLERWSKEDERIRHTVAREWCIMERSLVRKVREGGKGLCAAKASLEILERQFKNWARRTNVTLSSQLDEALDELEKKLPAEHYETVLKVLTKHGG